MKRLFCLVLTLTLLIPTISFASTSKNEFKIPEISSTLEQRNDDLLQYLIEKEAYGMNDPNDTEFFLDHPEYVETLEQSENKNRLNGNREELNTEVILKKEFVLDNGNIMKSEKEVTFYSDGTYMVSTLTVEKQPISPTNTIYYIRANNTHEYKNEISGALMYRTFVTAYFKYNGSTVEGIKNESSYNVRSFSPRVGNRIPYFTIRPPYGENNLSRAWLLTEFYDTFYGHALGQDDLRVTCNMVGEIFKN